MKILFCLTVYKIFTERCVKLAHRLVKEGHEVGVVVSGKSPDDIIDPTFKTGLCDWADFDFEAIHGFKPNLIIMWNGKFSFLHAAANALKRIYRVAIMEMAWFPQWKCSYISWELAQESAIADIPYVPDVSSNYLTELAEARSHFPQTSVEGLPEKFIFVPMQMELDTQILYTSPNFKTMRSLLGYIRQLAPYKTPIVIRKHPHALDAPAAEWALDFTATGKSLDIARQAKIIMGINSTLMAEALLFYKPCVNFGKHVAHDAMIKIESKRDVARMLDGEVPWNFRDRCDFRVLTLLKNQFDVSNPPDWIVEQICKIDFTPRTLPIPQKSPPPVEIQTLQTLVLP